MADGEYATPLPPMPSTREDAMIHLSIRLGAMEQAIRQGVTHEKLMVTYNDLRRDVNEAIRSGNEANKQMLAQQREVDDQRFKDLYAHLDRRDSDREKSFNDRIPGFVRTALDKERADEARARLEVDNKAKDAARGVRTIFGSTGAIFGGVIVVAAFLFAKYILHWSF